MDISKIPKWLCSFPKICNVDELYFESGGTSILNQFISENYALCHTASQLISIMDFVSRLLQLCTLDLDHRHGWVRVR